MSKKMCINFIWANIDFICQFSISLGHIYFTPNLTIIRLGCSLWVILLILFCFVLFNFVCGVTPRVTQGFLLTLHSGIHLGGFGETVWDSGDWTHIRCMQGKLLTCSITAPCSIFLPCLPPVLPSVGFASCEI